MNDRISNELKETKDRAIFNPTSLFKRPKDILDDNLLKEKNISLTQSEKVRALQTWLYDIQIALNSGEENMHPERNTKDEGFLTEIEACLDKLGVSSKKSGLKKP